MIYMDDMKSLRKRSRSLIPVVRIGKAGLTDSIIEEIRRQIKKRKLIKVRFLKSSLDAMDAKEFSKKISEDADCMLVDVIGLTASFAKARQEKD